MLNAENFNGFLIAIPILAVPIAVILGLFIRHQYRKAITREMMVRSAVPESAFEVPEPTSPNGALLTFDEAPLAQLRPIRRGLALRYFLAGLAFAVVATLLLFWVNEIEILPVRFSIVLASFALPGVIMALYVSGMRWIWMLALVLGWIGVMALIEGQAVTLLLILLGPPLFLSVLVANPMLRTTAIPVLFIAASFLIPLIFSLQIIFVFMTWGIFDPLLEPLGLEAVRALYYGAGFLVALAIGLLVAIFALRAIARLTAQSSAFMMQGDLIFGLQCYVMITMWWSSAQAWSLLLVFAFLAYRLTLNWLSPRDRSDQINLLLRVFGQQASQKGLARNLLTDWRCEGPVLLIGAADLATETLDAPELAAFLQRRLKTIFINTPEDLAEASADGMQRFSDGLFPMQDYYCRDNSWRPTVLSLMSQARRVLIDMRGFDPTNRGILFEIDALAARVPAERILIVAEAANADTIKALFTDAWARAGRAGETNTLALRLT